MVCVETLSLRQLNSSPHPRLGLIWARKIGTGRKDRRFHALHVLSHFLPLFCSFICVFCIQSAVNYCSNKKGWRLDIEPSYVRSACYANGPTYLGSKHKLKLAKNSSDVNRFRTKDLLCTKLPLYESSQDPYLPPFLYLLKNTFFPSWVGCCGNCLCPTICRSRVQIPDADIAKGKR